MTAIYNEIEPYAAGWLRNLIAAGHIAPGTVDTRSIRDVTAADVSGPGQRHFFAGIAAWSHALRLAGWPDDVSVWTGSCPCQPFSTAGGGGGFDDPRHLWPAWFDLIRECRPAVIFGEQVAGPPGLVWLDLVSADLENAGYAVGAADLCAAGVGAPHIRQRLYFVARRLADSDETGRLIIGRTRVRAEPDASQRNDAHGCGTTGELADSDISRSQGRGQRWDRPDQRATGEGGLAGELGDPDSSGGWRHTRAGAGTQGESSGERSEHRDLGNQSGAPGATGGFWSPCDWIPCRDGKARPVEPGLATMAHGSTARVGRLRGYGNAICAPLAAEFVRSAMTEVCS